MQSGSDVQRAYPEGHLDLAEFVRLVQWDDLSLVDAGGLRELISSTAAAAHARARARSRAGQVALLARRRWRASTAMTSDVVSA